MAMKTSTHLHDVVDKSITSKMSEGKQQSRPRGGTGGSVVQWAQLITSGTQIATITINGLVCPVYVPTGQMSVSWGSITGNLTDQADLATALNGKANSSHTHIIANVSGLNDALSAKASLLHEHAIEDVSELQVTLDQKASTVHSHTIADVSGLQNALSSKADSTHYHAISDVSGLQAAINSKSPLVTITPSLTTGVQVGTITIGSTSTILYAPSTTSIGVTKDVTSGTRIARLAITQGGTTTTHDLYAPYAVLA